MTCIFRNTANEIGGRFVCGCERTEVSGARQVQVRIESADFPEVNSAETRRVCATDRANNERSCSGFVDNGPSVIALMSMVRGG